jgi:hypothetical protein
MNFDLRIPIGLMFSLYGVLLTVYGLAAKPDLKQSLDINIDLIWGLVLLAFGALMLILAKMGAKAEAQTQRK